MIHLTDMEIQAYVLAPDLCHAQIVTHMQGCAVCRAVAEDYVVLFAGIQEQPVEVFDFDVKGLVLAEVALSALEEGIVLPEQNLKRGAPLGWLTAVSIVAAVALIYFFRGYIISLFSGTPVLLLYFILVPAGILVFFLLADMYKSYQKKITLLGRY